jgi:hypothetical protein
MANPVDPPASVTWSKEMMALVGKYAWNWGWPAAYRISPRLRLTGSK